MRRFLITATLIVSTMLLAGEVSRLLAGKTSRIPDSRTGQEVIGKELPLKTLRWLNTRGEKPVDTTGKVTLVRWWTDSCPYCSRSLPAIQDLQKRFGKRGLQTVAVYHPKPPRAVTQEKIIEDAIDRGFKGPIAVDDDWAVLRQFYLTGARRRATSVSFLLDGEGKVRFVHPGPELRAPLDLDSENHEEARIAADYNALQRAIEALLGKSEKKAHR